MKNKRLRLYAWIAAVVCMSVWLVSASASLVPVGLYVNADDLSPVQSELAAPLHDRYLVVVGECKGNEIQYHEGDVSASGTAWLQAYFQPVWSSEKESSAYINKPMIVRSSILTTEGISPFEEGKLYALFGRMTNQRNDATLFNIGKSIDTFSSVLSHNEKEYAYIAENPTHPFWMEMPAGSKSIALTLEDNPIWRSYLETGSISSASLYAPASIINKDAIGLSLVTGAWPDDSATSECAVSKLFADKNGLSAGDSLLVHPYPLAPSAYLGNDSEAPLGDIFNSLNNLVRSSSWPFRSGPMSLTIVGIYTAEDHAPNWAKDGNAVILR